MVLKTRTLPNDPRMWIGAHFYSNLIADLERTDESSYA